MIGGKVATLDIVKVAPVQYLVREGIVNNCGAYVTKFGKRALVSGGTRALAALSDAFWNSLLIIQILMVAH
jgi:hypothetical protein